VRFSRACGMRGIFLIAILAFGITRAANGAPTYNVLYNFAGSPNDGKFPLGSLTLVDSTLYGMTSQGGTNSIGTIFGYNLATGTETNLYSFGGTSDGAFPQTSFVQSGPILYATTPNGGSAGAGAIIAFNTATSTESVVYSLYGPTDGLGPGATLVESGSN